MPKFQFVIAKLFILGKAKGSIIFLPFSLYTYNYIQLVNTAKYC